jgi:chaperonin GroEL
MVRTSKNGEAYDFMSRKIIDTNENGLLDPVKVTTCALENAVSVASTLITTNYAVVKN